MYKKVKGRFQDKTLTLLFPPRGNKPLTATYPELREYEELTKITPKELLFIWYVTFVYSGFQLKDRIKLAITEVWGDDISEDDKNKLVYDNWNADLRAAQLVFEKFNLSARMKSRIIIETAFQNFQEIIKLDIQEIKDNKNWAELKKYTEVTSDIIKQLPDMVKNLETGNGVGEIRANVMSGTGNVLNTFYAKMDDENK